MVKKVPYAFLQECDYICTTGNSPFFDLLAVGIRLRTVGFWQMLQTCYATHNAIVVNIPASDGTKRFFIAEMLPDGLKINSMKTYMTQEWNKEKIVCVLRNSIYESQEIRTKRNDAIIEDANNVVQFGWKGAIKYLWPDEKEVPNEFYCSELLQHYAILDGKKIQNEHWTNDDDIPPVGIQYATNLNCVVSNTDGIVFY